MHIGIDARLLERKMTGMGRYLSSIVKFISEYDSRNKYFLFSFKKLKDFEKANILSVPTAKRRILPQKLFSPIWLNFVLPNYLRKYKIDLFFSPVLVPNIWTKCKKILVVADVLTKIDRNYFSFIFRWYVNMMKHKAIRKSAVIITISQNSKKDIMKFYKIPKQKIKVVYLAAEKRFCPRELRVDQKDYLRNRYNLPSKFILYVGVIEFRKNIRGVIEIADLIESETNIPILLFGRVGHQGKTYLKEIRKRKNIQYKGFIEDSDLPYIYNLATIFLFPSFYEGFGLPPLEAMQSGTPVLTSNSSSLPEVVGKGGIMHDPKNYGGFAEDIIKLLGDDNFYQEMREKGILQAKRFSWQKTAQEVIDTFMVLCKK